MFSVAIGDQSSNGNMLIYDECFELVKSFQPHKGQINRIKQLPNGYVATCSNDRTVKIWDPTNNWNLIQTFSNHTKNVYGLEYLDNDTMVTGGFDCMLFKWKISTGETIGDAINVNSQIITLQLLTNKINVAIGLAIKEIYIYDINDGSIVSVLSGHSDSVMDLVLLSESLLASSSHDKTIHIWDLTSNTSKFLLNGHTDNVYGLKLVSVDTLASGSFDNNIRLWNTTNGKPIRVLNGHKSNIRWSVDLFSDQMLVSGSLDQTLKLWDISTGTCLKTIRTGLSCRSLLVLDIPNPSYFEIKIKS